LWANAILDRAIAAAPNCALASTMSSVSRGYIGEGATAVKRAETGLRLSPLDGHAFWFEGQLAQAHYINGDYAAAVAVRKLAARTRHQAALRGQHRGRRTRIRPAGSGHDLTGRGLYQKALLEAVIIELKNSRRKCFPRPGRHVKFTAGPAKRFDGFHSMAIPH
jgi:hypothetical protein